MRFYTSLKIRETNEQVMKIVIKKMRGEVRWLVVAALAEECSFHTAYTRAGAPVPSRIFSGIANISAAPFSGILSRLATFSIHNFSLVRISTCDDHSVAFPESHDSESTPKARIPGLFSISQRTASG